MSMSLILIVQLLAADTPVIPAEELSPPAATQATPTSSAESDPEATSARPPDPPAAPQAASAPPAGANPEATSPQPPVKPALQWYGWQTLLVDLSMTALMLSPASFASPAVPLLFLSVYAVVPPVIHTYLHARPEIALGDLVLRIALPIVGFFAALPNFELFSPLPLAFWGPLLVGWFAPSLIDAAALAWEPAPERVDQRASGSWQWAPVVGAVRGAPVAGVAGMF